MKNSIIYFCSLIYFVYLCNTIINQKFNPLIFTIMAAFMKKFFKELIWNYIDEVVIYTCLILAFGLVQVFSTFNIANVEKWAFGFKFTLFMLTYLNTLKIFFTKIN